MDEKHGKSSEEDQTFMHARCTILLSLKYKYVDTLVNCLVSYKNNQTNK